MKKYKEKIDCELFVNYVVGNLKGKHKIQSSDKNPEKFLDTLEGENIFLKVNYNQMYLD
jgi:hypothetical protein